MNKFKLGQKVKIIRTGKIGEINNITSEDFGTSGVSNTCYRVEYIKENDWNWFTVHDLEEVKDMLDSKEKEYLRNIIKPFKNKVESIKKLEHIGDRQKEFITISIENDYPINLPYFKQNTMYKNMEINKEYTLEELGL